MRMSPASCCIQAGYKGGYMRVVMSWSVNGKQVSPDLDCNMQKKPQLLLHLCSMYMGTRMEAGI